MALSIVFYKGNAESIPETFKSTGIEQCDTNFSSVIRFKIEIFSFYSRPISAI